MAISDSLADMLTRIRNASKAHFNSVEIPYSNLKFNVAKVLQNEGYIVSYSIINNEPVKTLNIELKYGQNNERVISGIRRVSKPGHRIYKQSEKIPKVMSGLGISILTTSKGVITDKEARKNNIGGEVLCEVW